MTFQISVRNFRGIERAQIDVAPVALVCGQNMSGKSSLIDAVRAVVLGEKQPYGLTKTEIKQGLNFRGADQSACTVKAPGRETTITWPDADVISTGAPFRCSAFAAGATRFTALAERDLQAALSKYLNAAPNERDVTLAIADAGYDDEMAAAVWKGIGTHGWDDSWRKAREVGAKAKGAWENCTGEKFGSSKMRTWKPAGLETDPVQSVDVWQEQIDDAKKALETEIGKAAINADERRRLEGYIGQIPKLQLMVDERSGTEKRLKEIVDKAQRVVQAVPVVPHETWPTCPHCNAPIKIVGNRLESAPKPLTASAVAKIKADLTAAKEAFDRAFADHQGALKALETVKNDLRTALNAKDQIAHAANAEGNPVNLDAARQKVKALEDGLERRKKFERASALVDDIETQIVIVDLLAPDGLRRRKLAKAIDQFDRDVLGPLCKDAGWPAVTITEKMEILSGGRPIRLVAESEAFRVDVVLQIAAATIDKSEMVLIDRADILDTQGRNGLFALLSERSIPALVGMTIGSKKNAPDLAGAGMGKTYWIEKAETETIGG